MRKAAALYAGGRPPLGADGGARKSTWRWRRRCPAAIRWRRARRLPRKWWPMRDRPKGCVSPSPWRVWRLPRLCWRPSACGPTGTASLRRSLSRSLPRSWRAAPANMPAATDTTACPPTPPWAGSTTGITWIASGNGRAARRGRRRSDSCNLQPRPSGTGNIRLTCIPMVRFGLLAAVASTFAYGLLEHVPLTANFSRWYAWQSASAVLLLVATAGYGFWANLGGRPVWREDERRLASAPDILNSGQRSVKRHET